MRLFSFFLLRLRSVAAELRKEDEAVDFVLDFALATLDNFRRSVGETL